MARDALVGAGGMPLSADILRCLLASSQDVLYAVALDPVHMLYATPAFARRMGLPEDFLARGYAFHEYLASVHPDDQGRVAAIMDGIKASRSDAELPDNPACYRLRTPEGGWRVISDSYRLLRGPDGAPQTLIGNARDVSEQSEARQALAENEAHFRLLTENSRDLFFTMRFPDFRIEYLSPSYTELTGYSPEEHYADPGVMFRVIAPQWRGQVARWLEEIGRGEVQELYEYQILDRTGRLRWLHQRQVLVPAPDGQGLLLQGVATDITDLREASEALRASEEHFRQLIEAWPEQVMLSVNLTAGRHEYVSPSMERVMGYAPQEFYDDPGLGLRVVAPQWQKQAGEWLAELRAGIVRPAFEFELVHKNGAHRWIQQVGALRPRAPGQDLVVQFTFRDITEEHAAREALRASEERYRELAEGWLNQAVIRVNLHSGRCEYVSPGIERLFGFAPQDFYRGERSIVERCVAPEWRAAVREWAVEARDGVLRPEYEFELIDAWGQRRWVRQLCTLLHAADGTPEVVQGVLYDNTERHRLEDELRASRAFLDCIIEQSPMSMWISDEHGTLIRTNQALRRLFQVTEEEVAGRYNIFRDSQLEEHGFLPQIRQIFEQGGTTRLMLPYDTARIEGLALEKTSAAYLHATISAVQDAQGTTTNLIIQHLDITEQKRTEAALRTSQAFLDCIIEQSPMSMWISDERGTLMRTNRALRDRLGISDEEVVGRFNIFEDNQTLEQGFMPQVRQVFEQGGATRFILAYDTARVEGLDLARQSRAILDMTITAVQDAQGRTTNLIIQHLDISEQKRTEAALRESEALLEAMLRNLPFDFWARDMHQRIVMQSDESVRLWGDLTQKTLTDADFDRRTLELWRANNRRVLEGEIVSEEHAFTIRSGELREFHNIVAPIRDGESVLGLIGVNIDITEQKRAETALRESEERFRELVEGTQSLITQVDGAGRFTYVNPMVRLVLGLEPEDCIGRLAFEIVYPDDREATMAAFRGWVADRLPHVTHENRLISVSGEVRHFSWSIRCHYDASGGVTVIDSIARDITDQKRAEAALRESEARFRLIVETANEGIWTVDAEQRATFVNAAMARMLGYSVQEMLGVRTEEFLFPEDMEFHAQRMQLRRAGQDEVYERRFLRKDGTTLWTLASAKPLLDDQGRFGGAFAMFIDITERRRAEEALRQTNALYALLADNVVDVIWTTDAALRWTYISPSAENLSGIPMGRLMSMSFEELFTRESMGLIGELMARRKRMATRDEQDEAYRLEMDLRHADGSLVPLEVLVRPMRGPEGEIAGYCGTSRDITERRRAEAALRLSEARYALALKGANDGIWDWDLVEDQVYYSDRWKEIIGYAPDELRHDAQEWLTRIHPEDLDLVVAANERCIRGEVPIFQVEYRLRHKDGTYRWIFGRGAALADASGRVVRMAGAHTDITGRKQAEEALFKSERLSRKLLESMHEGVWAVDADRRTTFVNDRLCAMLGYASAELMCMSPTDVLEWPQRHVAEGRLPDLEAGNAGSTDYVLIRKDGTRFPAHVVSSPVMEDQGRFEGLVCGVVDLTERARMEHELRRNQARFEALYELSRLSPATEHQLAAFTLHEAIRLTESAAGVLFFASADGQTLVPKAWETGEFMAPGQVPSFPASGPLPWAQVLQSGLPLLINDFAQCAHLVPPGHPAVTRFLGVPALDGAQSVAVLALTDKDEPYTAEDTLQTTLLLDGMWREVRTRRDAERIRASLREKEALLHEVHHRVKNNLQVISSLMDLAGRRLSSDEARLSLSELRNKVQAMSLIHAQLHAAGNDGGISLERFVRALYNQLREVYAGGLDLSLWLQLGELTLSLDQAVPLGLALNETLTNVFKHACPPPQDGAHRASRVEIRAARDASGRVSIEVRDNGPGLPEGFSTDQAESLGMKLMKGLVRHQLRGDLVFTDAGPGVCVGIRFQPHMAK